MYTLAEFTNSILSYYRGKITARSYRCDRPPPRSWRRCHQRKLIGATPPPTSKTRRDAANKIGSARISKFTYDTYSYAFLRSVKLFHKNEASKCQKSVYSSNIESVKIDRSFLATKFRVLYGPSVSISLNLNLQSSLALISLIVLYFVAS